jgi:hypothetical protein
VVAKSAVGLGVLTASASRRLLGVRFAVRARAVSMRASSAVSRVSSSRRALARSASSGLWHTIGAPSTSPSAHLAHPIARRASRSTQLKSHIM